MLKITNHLSLVSATGPEWCVEFMWFWTHTGPTGVYDGKGVPGLLV